MTARESAETIAEQAARWVARLDRGDVDVATRAALDAWLHGDPRRQGAFLRAQAAWHMLDRASALGAPQAGEHAQPYPPAAAFSTGGPSRRRLLYAGGLGMAAAIAGVAFLPDLLARRNARYTTELGEIRQVPLADGSLAAINTESSMQVTLAPRSREVELDRGEAWFQVAKDRARPFVVAAGQVRVRAVGTAFSVRRRSDGADIQVTEGAVEVWTEGKEDRVVRMAAGARAFVDPSSRAIAPVEASAAIDRSLAWRTGQIILEGDRLEDAVAEFNRYNQRRVDIADPALAEERLVGRFRINDPESFAEAVHQTLGATIVHEGNNILIKSAP